MSKTRVKRNDVYFNGDRNAGRMGGTYMINAKVYDADMNNELLSYNFYHLVVDDELSNCLPFIDPGENWCVYLCLPSLLLYTHKLQYDIILKHNYMQL